jgi:glutamate racemase
MVEVDGAIGIFDSGFGGLTVARRIMESLPNESMIYLGDTARLPYGTKSPATVIRYAETCTEILVSRGIKLLVVACNTASAHAIPILQDKYPIPVVGVVEPGARAAVEVSRGGVIGVIATEGTIESNVYALAIEALAPNARVVSTACPLFVPLAEEGWVEGDVPFQVATEYLKRLANDDMDTLVLGCTHYPLLSKTIQRVIGDRVTLVDSAKATARVVEEILGGLRQLSDDAEMPIHEYIVSDDPKKFSRIGEKFLGKPIDMVEWLDF